ncbi:unnamed protein product [Dibothriocephalus latus]|uniref:Uncharacterized protein n=1 Tax=Dibothriocephalus latus TaxID=60516 RepID=A0A3P7M3T5_DIBLA|nr:unnamed protein product [Dibothriocephalus latus]
MTRRYMSNSGFGMIACLTNFLVFGADCGGHSYIPNSVIRQTVKFCGVVPERVTARKRELESSEEVTSKEETMASGGEEDEQTKSRAASLKEARHRVLREAVAKERELKQQQKTEVAESEFKKQFREEGRESPDDDSRE